MGKTIYDKSKLQCQAKEFMEQFQVYFWKQDYYAKLHSSILFLLFSPGLNNSLD